MNKIDEKIYMKNYRETHKDKMKAYNKIYCENHKDEITNYYKNNKDKLNEKRRIYKRNLYLKNPEYKEKNRIYMREYCRKPENIERRKIWAKEYGRRPEVLAQRKIIRDRPENKLKTKMRTKNKVFALLGNKCVYCGCDNLNALEINHKNGGGTKERKKSRIISLWQAVAYGHRKIDDLELVCRVCNAVHYLELKGITGFNVIWQN